MASDEHSDFHRIDQTASGGVERFNPRKRKGPTYGPHSVDSYAVSKMDQETFSFLWSLENYSTFKGSKQVTSPVFRGGPISNHSWQLKIWPKKKIEELEYFSVCLQLTGFGDGDTSHNRKVKVRHQISLLDDDGRPRERAGSATMNVCEFKKRASWGWDKFILSTDLISSSRRLVFDDSLKIHCRVWIEGDTKHTVCNGGTAKKSLSEEEKVKRQKEKLAHDFGKLFQDSVMTDIRVTTDNSTFMAHKNVLAARSPVFAAMFNTNMMEKESNTVEIPDFEDDIVKAMLEYLYTGETELLNERAPDLLQIADKYDLVGLKENCEYTIADNLKVETAAQVLVMAHMYNASLLKPRVIDFIKCNTEAVGKSESFVQVAKAHPNLIADLYLSQLGNVSKIA